MKTVTAEEVQTHNKPDDFWLIIDGMVYDLSSFAAMHPGGENILYPYAGKDATEVFYELHRRDVLQKYGPKLLIGKIADAKPQVELRPGAISRVPYAESPFFQNLPSAYFKPSHMAFKKALREFMDTVVRPEAIVNDADGKPPSKELFEKAGEYGLLAARIGPGAHLKGRKLPGGVTAEEFDYFHELIAQEEMAVLGLPGYADGLGCGMVIGLPPVLHFGSKSLVEKVVPEVLSGKKRICLSITEPFTGSDVANIQATAVKSDCGRFYIVNGVKKWITNGTFCEYFATAVKTGGPNDGMGGVSMLLVERSEGLRTKPIKTSYSSAAGTAYVIMENVKVPVENLLGKENEGFKCIMFNFNHERWLIVCQSIRFSRLVVEECLKWAHQRKVFGRQLIEQPVIRAKLAHMIAQVESVQSWLESITYQMTKMSYKEQSIKLAGPIALLKLQATRVGQFVSDESCQIFGGRAITQTGMGQVIERYHKATKFAAILGGSEEIMADLGVRQAMKFFPKNARL